MKKLSVFVIGFICVIFLCSTGCSRAKYSMQEYGGMAARAAYDNFESEKQMLTPAGSPLPQAVEESPSAIENAVHQERKLVKRANLQLRVEDPSVTEKPLAALMEKYKAWPASTGVYENSRDYSIRVPSSSYEAMLGELTGLGRVVRRNEHAEDVTLRYYDLESRLATKRELLKTYQSYLGKASSIDEIMKVESRIADLQQEIDWTGTQLRNLSSLVDYSTIDLEITGPLGTSSYSSPSLGEKMRELFGSFGEVISSGLVVLIGIIIYGVPVVLIIILLFWLLFGRIGLIKRLWRLAMKPSGTAKE